MFHGSLVALVTPMLSDGTIDVESLQNLIDWQIESGTNGLVILGTTGESPTISDDEREQVIELCVEQAKGRVPVIVGTGSNSTSVAIRHTEEALELGADAALLVTPYYNKPSQEGMYRHFKAIADAVPIPQILYNVPPRTACDLLPETIERLSKISNIIGVKEATGDPERAKIIHELCGQSMDVYSGVDSVGLAVMKVGGKGVISVTANVAPQKMAQMCQAALAGNFEQAEKINKELEALHEGLFIESNPTPVKWALTKMGKIAEGIRLPLTTLSSNRHEKLGKILSTTHLI